MEEVADRLRRLLRSPLVLIFVQRENLLQLQAIAAEVPGLAERVRGRAQENDLRSALEIATRAVAAGERITVNIDGASHFGEDSPAGTLVAAPFRTSRSYGAILVYPRAVYPRTAPQLSESESTEPQFTEEEKTLISAVAGVGAVVAANAELSATARAQAQELQELLDIS
ncbi:MAG: hypothetical protein WA609_14605, partial [Terriglobales bacterium]